MAKRTAKKAKRTAAKPIRRTAKVARKPARAAANRKTAAKATARKPASRKAPARKPAARKTARAKVKRPAQRFAVSHPKASDFGPGLRSYARYRDLGFAKATGGLVQAHVIRMVPPVTDEVRKRHIHDVELQLVYVLKGSMTTDFEGQGPVTMRAGSCWLQPPNIKHTVLDYSDDCEVLEIVVPADFKTAEA
jgi:mannose-6-phosphate isomerase-like protein (cupin superfamily)